MIGFRVLLGVSLGVMSLTVSYFAQAGEDYARFESAPMKPAQSTYQTQYQRPALQAASNPAALAAQPHRANAPVVRGAMQTRQMRSQPAAKPTEKATCTGPKNGSVTYPGSKKRYDLMGRRIK